MKPNKLYLLPLTTLLSMLLTACGGGSGGDNGSASDTSMDQQIAANASNFFTPSVLLANLPDMPNDIASYASEPYNSYMNASAKGNDQASTKRPDIVKWYNAIRYADPKDLYHNFDGSARVYAEVPNWTKGQYRMGILGKAYLSNHVDYYNLLRALFGGQRVFISGYKEVASQASSFSDLAGGHYPSKSTGEAAGMTGALFSAIYSGRSGSNLQGGVVNRNFNYAAATTLPRNSDLTSVWNEAASGNIAGLGHRAAFMYAAARDIGVGIVAGFHSWEVYGDGPASNNGGLLGAAAQQAIYDKWPRGPVPGGAMSWPSHGYFPFFVLNAANQGYSLSTQGAYFSIPAKGEIITLKMEYFVHAKDGDLSQLQNPVQSISVSAVAGQPNSGTGAINLLSGKPDYVNAEQIPNGASGAQYEQGGGYYFTASGGTIPFQWRMPQNWYNAMQADFKGLTPSFHTLRFTFSGSGAGFKVQKPFYMNPSVGAALVIQTSFFDIRKQAN